MFVKRKKVAACAKNYVGEGGTMRGISESNSTVIDWHGLLNIYSHACLLQLHHKGCVHSHGCLL